MKKYDVYALGNALLDVGAHTTPASRLALGVNATGGRRKGRRPADVLFEIDVHAGGQEPRRNREQAAHAFVDGEPPHVRLQVGFEVDPKLNLDVEVAGLPLSALTRIIDEDLPLQGALAKGSSVRIEGTAARPSVNGTLRLNHLAASGIPLGDGDIN